MKTNPAYSRECVVERVSNQDMREAQLADHTRRVRQNAGLDSLVERIDDQVLWELR